LRVSSVSFARWSYMALFVAAFTLLIDLPSGLPGKRT
jgi:hypothetical protein